jgi:hypothetical protein
MNDLFDFNKHMESQLISNYNALESLQAKENKLSVAGADESHQLNSPLFKQKQREKRKRLGVKNKEDIEYESKLKKIFFENLYKYNYPHYLLLTGNFNEYRKYFKHYSVTHKGRKISHSIKMRFNKALNAAQTSLLSSTDPKWMKCSQMMGGKYEYFITHLTKEYHDKQCLVINQHLDLRDTRLQALIERIDKNTDKTDKTDTNHVHLAKDLKDIQQQYKKKRIEITNEINLEAKYYLLRTLEKEFTKEYQSTLRLYAPQSQQVALELQNDIKSCLILEKILIKNETEFTHKVKELREHQAIVLRSSVKEIEQDFSILIKYMLHDGVKCVDKNKSLTFSEQLSQLNSFREALKYAKDPDYVNKIIDESNHVVTGIDKLVNSTIDRNTLQQWSEAIGQFDKLSYSIDESKTDQDSRKRTPMQENKYVSSNQSFFSRKQNFHDTREREKKPRESHFIDNTINAVKEVKTLDEEEQNKLYTTMKKVNQCTNYLKKNLSKDAEEGAIIKEIEPIIAELKQPNYEQVYPASFQPLYKKLTNLKECFELNDENGSFDAIEEVINSLNEIFEFEVDESKLTLSNINEMI